MSRHRRYTLINIGGIALVTICMAGTMHLMDYSTMTVPVVILGIFFCVANTCSIYVRSLFRPSRSNTITSFYLIDKTVRFLASIMLFGVLIYIYRNNGLVLGLVSFTYYITAMALELSYFFAIERKKRIQNA